MAGRKQKQDEGGGVPGWMVTYGDMMSLLLTFFVLLLSFSAPRTEDFQEALESIRAEIVILDLFATPQETIIEPVIQTYPKSVRELRSVKRRLEEALMKTGLEEQVQFKEGDEQLEGGLRITIQAPVLFASGSAELRPEAREVLEPLLEEIVSMPNDLVIEGHTDNVPIHTVQFPSNWELSTARAIAVARYFIDRGGLDPKRFGVAGYGEFRPVQSNATAEGRAANRRVELFIKAGNGSEQGPSTLDLLSNQARNT